MYFKKDDFLTVLLYGTEIRKQNFYSTLLAFNIPDKLTEMIEGSGKKQVGPIKIIPQCIIILYLLMPYQAE